MWVALVVALVAVPAQAGPSRNAVTYAGVDASTVRVFAVGTVGVETLKHEGHRLDMAVPQAGHGTGFAVDRALILTANHVVAGARHVVIRHPGEGGLQAARVVYTNADDDVAVLYVDANLKAIRLRPDSQPLRVRQTVFAIGYPLDPTRKKAQSAKGIVAGHTETDQLQLDIALNPGNSGGPVVDENDQVIGLVSSRGNPEKGVQGIGIAVPNSKLRAAITIARELVTEGSVPPISEHESLSAEVVDSLVTKGTLATGDTKSRDLSGRVENVNFQQIIDELAARLGDADLLVFVAGNMWNAALALRYGGVRALGERTLSEHEAQSLAGVLETASIQLARRGNEIDGAVMTRSSFVRVALTYNRGPNLQLHDGGSAAMPSLAMPSLRSRWTFQTYLHVRQNGESDGMGLGLELKDQLAGRRMFFSWGASLGRVDVALPDARMSVTHSYYALEAGLGVRFPVGTMTQLELYAGVAPCYYTASVDDPMGMEASRSGVVLDHFRATASLAVGRLYLSTGVRAISDATWYEPLGVGINF
jgi:hypothetical protein